MKLSALRTYFKFLSRHKVYTVVSIVGFAISLTFVIILSLYAKTQVSMDSFHQKKDRIYMLVRDDQTWNANPVGDYVTDLCPEVEAYTRIVDRRLSIGLNEQEWFDGRVMMADAAFFDIFTFPLTDGNPGDVIVGEDMAVLSETTATRLFGEEYPVGRTILIDRRNYTVTGIMEDFPYNTHLEAPDVVINYGNIKHYWGGGDILNEWGNCSFVHYFLERENADLPSKTAMILGKFMEDYWIFERGHSKELSFVPLEDIYFTDLAFSNVDVKKGSRTTTSIYMGIAILILVIAVLNYINMTVAQAGFRGKEAAVKKLMGSGKGGIIMQLLYESLVMTAFASLFAVLLAFLSEPYFNRILGTTLELKHQFDTMTILAVTGSVILISFVSGIIPALAVSSFRPIEVVKGTITRKVKSGYSKVLIVFQFTVCTALLIATFLMSGQTRYMLNRDIGFNKDNLLMLDNVVGNQKENLEGMKSRLMQIPGVEAVGLSSGSPLDGGNNNSFSVDDVPVSMQVLSGDSVYFRIFGFKVEEIPAAYGTAEHDIVYLNRAGYNAIRPDSTNFLMRGWGEGRTVIGGIFEDIHIRSLHQQIGPTMFYFLRDGWWPWNVVVKLSSSNVYETAAQVRQVYDELSGGRQYDWYFADERIEGWYENERRMSKVMGTFTVLSIVIMVMGVFAMSVYMIRQKEKEIGVRKVNGATIGQILAMLNLQSLVRVAIAFVIACPVAWYGMSKWLHSFPYRVDIGIWPFILAGIIVTILCLVSVSWQTFRAARANPVESLKSE